MHGYKWPINCTRTRRLAKVKQRFTCPIAQTSAQGYAPHIDSVRHREKRTQYAVHRFDAQLGGILLLQAPERQALQGEGKTPGVSQPGNITSPPH